MLDVKKELLNKTKLNFYKEIKKYQNQLKPTKEIEGYGTAIIVGEKNYPDLKIHNVSNFHKDSSFFNTSEIVKKNYNDIIKHKAANILGSTQNIYIKKTNERIKKELEDIYKSKKAIEFSSKFENELKFNKIIVNKISGIVGSKNSLRALSANENISTSKQIEKFITKDIKAKDAIISLYEKSINEHQIISLLSLGNFGVELNKKLVPTKWSISAYDQIIEKYLHLKIIKYSLIEKYEIYHHKDKGNDFLIILLPDTFSAEVIESFSEIIEKDYVDFNNKLKNTQPNTAGGFYATKIGIFEYLNTRKKQAAFISIRIINNYEVPLGVVFVRECIRNAVKNKIFTSSNEKELKEFLISKFKSHFYFYKDSTVLKERKKQEKLTKFL